MQGFKVEFDITACPECEVISGPHAKKMSFPLTRPPEPPEEGHIPSERDFVKLRATQSAIALQFPLESQTGHHGCF